MTTGYRLRRRGKVRPTKKLIPAMRCTTPHRGGTFKLLVGVLNRRFKVRLFRQRIIVLPLQCRKSVLYRLQLRLVANHADILDSRVRKREVEAGSDTGWTRRGGEGYHLGPGPPVPFPPQRERPPARKCTWRTRGDGSIGVMAWRSVDI